MSTIDLLTDKTKKILDRLSLDLSSNRDLDELNNLKVSLEDYNLINNAAIKNLLASRTGIKKLIKDVEEKIDILEYKINGKK